MKVKRNKRLVYLDDCIEILSDAARDAGLEDECEEHTIEKCIRTISTIPAVDAVIIPHNGSKVEVKFDSGNVLGTLQIGGEVYNVYLGNMEAHQLGCEHERYCGKPCLTPSNIKRKFTLIEM